MPCKRRKLSTSSEDELRETLTKMDIMDDSILEPNEMVMMILVLTICDDTEYFQVIDAI
jgi:surfactin synthase thioesterase subunit